jgi:predicted porin
MLSIYGSLGLAVRCKSNATPQGGTLCGVGAAPTAFGDLGLYGVEELGGGYQTYFNLEAAFEPNTGTLTYPRLLLGREASLGIGTPLGRIDVGRLNIRGTAAEPLVRADPTNGGGSYLETLWPGLNSGIRFSNAVRYRFALGPVFGTALVSAGEVAALGSTVGRTLAATLGYTKGPAYVVAAYQTNHDKNDRENEVFDVGGYYILGDVTLHGAYLHAKREQGFMIGAYGEPLYASGLGLAPDVPSVGGFATNFVLAGITYKLQPPVVLRAAWFYAVSRQGTLIATEGGKQQSVYAVVDYAMSKRTFLEVEVDWNRWTGGWSGFWGSTAESGVASHGDPFRNGFSTRATISVGMRHDF